MSALTKGGVAKIYATDGTDTAGILTVTGADAASANVGSATEIDGNIAKNAIKAGEGTTSTVNLQVATTVKYKLTTA